jgi:8-oxo-dGTP pyrophosphatase MutT (NUDIX family)
MKKLNKWKILQSTMVFDNQWCKVRQDQVELPSGNVIDDFFVNVRPEITLILPITSNKEIVLVRQYRHGVGEILLELPAGSFDPAKESAELAALRELQEETGYIGEQLTKLATIYDNPVKDTNRIHLFLVENVKQSGEQQLDITEDIEVVLVPIEAVMEKIAQGEICVSGSVAAIFLGLNFISRAR